MRGTLTQRLWDSAGMSAESLPGQPLIELCGNSRVLVENHQGVAMYTTEQICVRVKFGEVCIRGQHLRLCHMQGQQLVIQGQIGEISLHGRCK